MKTNSSFFEDQQKPMEEWLEVSSQERFLDTRYIPTLVKKIPKPMASFLCQALTISDLLPLHAQLPPITEAVDFAESILQVLKAKVEVATSDLEKIPRTGATVVVCNHPYGGMDGISLIATLLKIRPDAKFLVNSVLGIFPDLRKCCFPLDILSNSNKAKKLNQISLKMADRHLAQGGLLVVFPSGTVSHWQFGKGVSDPQWQTTAARLAKRNEAPVVPVFFAGRNSIEFQTVGLIHPYIRTLLLPREVKKRIGSTIKFSVGNKIEARTFELFTTPELLTAYLRARCYDLRYQHKGKQKANLIYQQAIAEKHEPLSLARELARLPESALLISEGVYQVYLVSFQDSSLLKEEVGRVREFTFRSEGEGSGYSRDLDKYDDYYEHLVLWHTEKKQIIGGYRLMQTSQALVKSGAKALYTHSLFHISKQFFEKYADSLELGRAFIHPNSQAEYQPLLLLWKGIGRYLLRYPYLRWLYGPVSMSLNYTPLSLSTIICYLKKRYENTELTALVKGRNYSEKMYGESSSFLGSGNIDYKDISNLVKEIDGQKGIPILFKHYLKLGGTLASFNLDKDFNTIDMFLLLDLSKAPRAALNRYFTPEGAQYYLYFHEERTRKQRIS